MHVMSNSFHVPAWKADKRRNDWENSSVASEELEKFRIQGYLYIFSGYFGYIISYHIIYHFIYIISYHNITYYIISYHVLYTISCMSCQTPFTYERIITYHIIILVIASIKKMFSKMFSNLRDPGSANLKYVHFHKKNFSLSNWRALFCSSSLVQRLNFL